MTLACTGIGICSIRNVAIGEAWLLRQGAIEVRKRWVHPSLVEEEVQRFRQAVEAARGELKAVRNQIPDSTPTDISAFIDTHLLMLEDGALIDAPVDMIRQQYCGAEWALQQRRDDLVRVFDEMEDPYLCTRKDDVDHVVNQIQKILLDRQEDESKNDKSLAGKVIVARDLTPADTILLRHQGVAAFITEYGGPMSHTAILARSLGIPAVVGVRHATQCLQQGEMLVVDGSRGVVLTGADDRILSHFRRRLDAELAHADSLRSLIDQPAVSTDGIDITLLANIELPEDIEISRNVRVDGVGLYRTEFLYMNRAVPPSEEEHYESYRRVVEGLSGIPISVRTLDLGADKEVDGHYMNAQSSACNPALGLRAIRLCLKEPELFRPQLRAILRASALGPVRIMIPMLSNLQELRQVKALIEEAKRELSRDGLAFDPNIPIGGMIEVPAAALAATTFARHLDFLSIGTNDLVQYTLAIDRVDDEVNYLYDFSHPSVLKLIQLIIDAAAAVGKPVSMCGEMAANPRYIPLLLGMGLRRLSMGPGSVLEAKRVVRNSHIGDLTKQVRHFMARIDEDEDGIQRFLARWRS